MVVAVGSVLHLILIKSLTYIEDANCNTKNINMVNLIRFVITNQEKYYLKVKNKLII